MAGAAAFAGASAGLDILSGLFDYFASQEAGATLESRGRMLRLEAETDAQLYAEQARNVKARQKLAYLKSGVELSGSPLDIIDRDILTAREQISAIKARGVAQEFGLRAQADQVRSAGRMGILKGIVGGAAKTASAYYIDQKIAAIAGQNRKDLPLDGR